MNRRVVVALATLGALALPGCDQSSTSKPAPASSSAAPTPAAPQITVTHVLIAFKGPMTERMAALKNVTRSKADAQRLAKSLLTEVQGGRSFDDLVEKFTEDRDQDGKANTNNAKPGSYTWPTPQIPAMDPAFEKASRETPVGKMAPEPVETVFGYHLIRRDK